PFHHVAIAAEGVDVIGENRKSWPVEVLLQPSRRNGHADAVAAALAQWTGGDLHTRGVAVFGMAGACTAELAEILDVLERDGETTGRLLRTGQVQHGIEQHRS